ncbi:MAG: I78 family peptidase inhibitor [Paracoccus sp. (in: a-proteobacteria)]|nr:I78 family peptidase inhibitor [Paracoccus sp. (in: a-proteobacteria)]
MRGILALAPLLLLMACAEADMADRMPPPSDECRASRFQGLIGQKAELARGLRVDGPVRLIGPNMPVTADYSAARLNIEYDGDGVITRISCY